jgi:hypothetical protein
LFRFYIQGTAVEATGVQKLNQGTNRKWDVIIFGRLFGSFWRSKKNKEQ